MNRNTGNLQVIMQHLQQLRSDITQVQHILRILMQRHTELEGKLTAKGVSTEAVATQTDYPQRDAITEDRVIDIVTRSCDKLRSDLQRDRIVMEAMLTEKAEKTAARVVMLNNIAVKTNLPSPQHTVDNPLSVPDTTHSVPDTTLSVPDTTHSVPDTTQGHHTHPPTTHPPTTHPPKTQTCEQPAHPQIRHAEKAETLSAETLNAEEVRSVTASSPLPSKQTTKHAAVGRSKKKKAICNLDEL